jgi:hypothetical protein
LKLPAGAEKFSDFRRFPAILLNFQLKTRISSNRTELPPTTRVFQQNFGRAADSGENPV